MTVVNFDEMGGRTIAENLYDTFINRNEPEFGDVPKIISTNSTLLQKLLDDGHAIQFGAGIYPFDQEIVRGDGFDLRGVGRTQTLLWAPQSNFMHYTSGGAVYPVIKDMTIEAHGNVLLTDAWAVNAIHALRLSNSVFVSYTNHVFHNDYSQSGGTGCPIYGCKIENIGVYSGPDKAAFYGWSSGSNVFDNVVDQHLYFRYPGNAGPKHKGRMKALFWNSTVHKYCNSNVHYAGFDYVYLYDRKPSMTWFGAEDNNFEVGSCLAICKVDTSNFFLNTRNNRYLSGGNLENGHHYIIGDTNGNCYVTQCDSPIPLYDGRESIRNTGRYPVRAISGLLDANKTKRRMEYHDPEATTRDGQRAPHRPGAAPSPLPVVSASLAAELHMSDMLEKYDDIGYVIIREWSDVTF